MGKRTRFKQHRLFSQLSFHWEQQAWTDPLIDTFSVTGVSVSDRQTGRGRERDVSVISRSRRRSFNYKHFPSALLLVKSRAMTPRGSWDLFGRRERSQMAPAGRAVSHTEPVFLGDFTQIGTRFLHWGRTKSDRGNSDLLSQRYFWKWQRNTSY